MKVDGKKFQKITNMLDLIIPFTKYKNSLEAARGGRRAIKLQLYRIIIYIIEDANSLTFTGPSLFSGIGSDLR